MQASHFEGLITTIVGYILLAMTLILCHVSFKSQNHYLPRAKIRCNCTFCFINVCFSMQALLILNGCLRDWPLWSGFSAPGGSWESAILLSRSSRTTDTLAHKEAWTFSITSITPSSIAGVSAGGGGDRRFSAHLRLVARHLLFSKILSFSSLKSAADLLKFCKNN